MTKMATRKKAKHCPLCQDPSGTGHYEKTYYPKTTSGGAFVGLWQSKHYTLTGNKLTVNVTAMHETAHTVYYDTGDEVNDLSMHFRIAFCPLCRRKITTRR